MNKWIRTAFGFAFLAYAGAGTVAQEPKKDVKKDDKPKITYDQHVLPILREKCLSCHNADKQKGGLDLSTYTQMMAGGSSGEAVKAGDPDGSRLVLLSSHKEEPKMPPNSPPLAKESLDTFKAWISGGLLENNGSKAVVAKVSGEVGLVSVKRGRPEGPPPMPVEKLPLDPVLVTPRANAVTALAASPWAPLIAVGAPKQVLLYHGETMNLVGVLPFKHGMTNVLKFSRNGGLLLAGGGRGGQSGKVVVWDVKTGKEIVEVGEEHDAVLAADISADQKLIALGGPGKMIRIYATKDGSLVREIKKHTDWIYALEFSPDAVLLASADRSGGLFVWEAADGKEFYALRGHTGPVLDIAWRDDSNILASASEDGSLQLWEMENGKNIKKVAAHGGGTLGVKFAHDNRIATVGRDRVPKVWDAAGNTPKNLKPTDDVSMKVAFSHDGTIIYAGDWNGNVKAIRVVDDVVLGTASTNPPTFAQRLAISEKTVIERAAALEKAKAAVAERTKGSDAANTSVAQVAKLAEDIKKLEAALPAIQSAADKSRSDLKSATDALTAKTEKQKMATEASTKAGDALKAKPEDAELKAKAEKAKKDSETAASEVAAAKKMVDEKRPLVAPAAEKFAAIRKELTDKRAASKDATAALPARQKAAKDAGDALNTAKAALAAAEAELKTASTAAEALKAQAKNK